MATLKKPKIGLYQQKDRLFQRNISFEKTALSWKTANVYRYLGDATQGAGALITDIQDTLILENPDRRYDTNPVEINVAYEEFNESPFDLSKFGIINPLGNTNIFRIHVNSFDVDGMGRYIMVGDVLEVPFLVTNGNAGNKAFFEVTDVDRKMEFENFYVTVTTVPIKDSQEFEDINEIPSNSDALQGLQDELDKAYQATFTDGGLTPEPSLYVERDYVDDDYVDDPATVIYTDGTTKPYDPRPDKAESFLDDPNSEIF